MCIKVRKQMNERIDLYEKDPTEIIAIKQMSVGEDSLTKNFYFQPLCPFQDFQNNDKK